MKVKVTYISWSSDFDTSFMFTFSGFPIKREDEQESQYVVGF